MILHPARTKVISCGRRWGKTFLAGLYALTVADYGGAVAWVAPTYRNARAPWRFAEQFTAPAADRIRMNRSEQIMEFPSGGRLSVYSADNDTALRGESFDVVVVDEAARIREETYTDVLLPTLADRDGRILCISTPKGRNWFWREWVRGQGDGKTVASWTAPSSANPMPTIRAAAAAARGRVSDRTYRQEWLAEFVEDGTFFPNVTACATAVPQTAGQSRRQYAIGVDWARAADGDYTVYAVMDVREQSLVHLTRFAGVDFGTQRSRLRTLHNAFNHAPILAESNAMGGPQVEALQADGLPVLGFTTTAASKHELITALELAFDRQAIRILDDPVLIAELQAYERRERAGYPAYSAPEGMHDDTVIALALAWEAAHPPPAISIPSISLRSYK